jgi:ankyrin repeat protein
MTSTEALFAAIDADDAETIRRLIAEDPSLARVRDDRGVSALMRARYRGAGPSVDAISERVGELDVFEAATFGDLERLRALLAEEPGLATAYAADGFTALHFAAFFGTADVVEALLAAGAEVDAAGRGWMTGTPLHSAAASANEGAVRALLSAGADPNARQSGGGTPLHAAAANADIVSVRALMAEGADPAATTEDGRSALDRAEERGDPASIELLRTALQSLP